MKGFKNDFHYGNVTIKTNIDEIIKRFEISNHFDANFEFLLTKDVYHMYLPDCLADVQNYLEEEHGITFAVRGRFTHVGTVEKQILTKVLYTIKLHFMRK